MSVQIQSAEQSAEQIAEQSAQFDRFTIECVPPSRETEITFDNLVVGNIYVDEITFTYAEFYRVKSKGAKFATLERLRCETSTVDYLYNLPETIAGKYRMTKGRVTLEVAETLKMVYNNKFGGNKQYNFSTTPYLNAHFSRNAVAYYYKGEHIRSNLMWGYREVYFFSPYSRGNRIASRDFAQFCSHPSREPKRFFGVYKGEVGEVDMLTNPQLKPKWRIYMGDITVRREEDPSYFTLLEAWYTNSLRMAQEEEQAHEEVDRFYSGWPYDFTRTRPIPLWRNLGLGYKRELIAQYQPEFEVWESQRQQLTRLMTFEHNEQMVRNIPSHADFRYGTNEQRAELLAQLQAFHDETVRQQDEQIALARERRRQEELERLGSYLTPEAPEARQERLQAQVAPEIVEEEPLAPDVGAVVVPEQPQAPEAEQRVEVVEVAPEEPPNGW